MKMKKLSTIALAAAMAIGTFGFSVPAKAADNSTDYTITIPATLTVAQSGWNATDGITAQVKSGDTFDSSKKLTVTASSANEWNLKSGENAIAYKMASATEQEKSYADATATTSLEISAEDLNTGNYIAPFGIVVEDYSDKPAGEYKDTVTFTAKVETAGPQLHSITLTGPYSGDKLEMEFYEGDTWSDMAAKYSKLKIIRNWIGFGRDGMISKNDDWVLTTDTIDPNATYTIE